jgi:hypothetical protein
MRFTISYHNFKSYLENGHQKSIDVCPDVPKLLSVKCYVVVPRQYVWSETGTAVNLNLLICRLL